MANVQKKISRGIHTLQRSVQFDQSEVSQGDHILVEESLGRPAKHLQVEASGGYLQFRLNERQTIFPRRPNDDLQFTQHLPNLASGVTYLQSGTAIITVEDGTTYSMDNEMPISDIHLITIAGQFDMYLA